ncbi:MAG: histidinol-phosphate aminotransferase family protein [Euryarchaeota archaeon]|nr:histidinol-phosphate aminotransferase family protein [Euryarchaeota archaeon]
MIDKAVRPEIRSMTRPRHGGDVWNDLSVKDYSSNINPFGPPSMLGQYISEAAIDLHCYPDDSCTQLKDAIASHYETNVENIIVGAGSSELIRLFAEVFISRGDRVVMPSPTFSEYGFGCNLMGAELIEYTLPREQNFDLNVTDLSNQLSGAKAVYVCNPNNPTGRMTDKNDILRLIEEAARKETLVFLDETLLELSSRSSELSLVSEVENYENLFIIRSFTKSFAMPGIRVGYGFGSKEMINYLEAGRLTWNLGIIEQRVAIRLIEEEQDHVAAAVNMLDEEKLRMHSKVERLMGEVPMPDSYFFFAPLNHLGISSSEFRSAMLRHGVLVRDCSSFGNICSQYTRFCIKTPDKNDEFLDALSRAIDDIGEGRL